ncbi:hypothetical protein [Kitasatospora sp. NBC_01302]|uniref:hypothetical protein n=1 Tax=Kitasatospora sp. NBC_01302 TaxID=2903575 RepID=UPI002E15F0B7|nr:hypothetical protein OG294_40910 [Kitasatospora sp. NBC_01302]
MNVRIDWEQPSGPQQPRRSPAPGGPGGKRKGLGKDAKLFGALGVGALVTVVAALAIGGGHKNDGGHKGGAPLASASASAGSDTGGMVKGTALASGSDGTRRIGGLPRGFAHNTDGAVEAATALASAEYTVQRMTPADRAAWVKDVEGSIPPGTEDKAKLYQSQNSLNSAGQLIDSLTSQPSTDRRFTSLCHPELGAYRLVDSAADAVTVDVWQVCISGVIGPGSESSLKANWMLGEITMSWSDGDWRLTKAGAGNFNTPPAPANGGQAVISYADRAKILAGYGSGWELYRDASETAPAEMGAAQ